MNKDREKVLMLEDEVIEMIYDKKLNVRKYKI